MRSASLALAALVAIGTVTWAAGLPARFDAEPLAAFDAPLAPEAGPEIAAERLVLQPDLGQVFLDGEPFTGTAIETYPDGTTAARIAYARGRKHGLTERFFPDGTPSYRATYASNRRDGLVETWWQDGTLRTESHYAAGVASGVQRQWYQSGALFKELTLEDGHEAGLQRAWRENGALYANYEARDGRIYGLKRANLCYTVEDEEPITRAE